MNMTVVPFKKSMFIVVMNTICVNTDQLIMRLLKDEWLDT